MGLAQLKGENMMRKKNFKKTMLAGIVCFFVLVSINGVLASQITFETYINADKVKEAARVFQSEEYLPLDIIIQKLNLDVEYDSKKNTIYLEKYDRILVPVLYEGVAYVNLKDLTGALKGKILFDYNVNTIKLDTIEEKYSDISANEIINKINTFIGKNNIVLPVSSFEPAHLSGLSTGASSMTKGIPRIKCKYCNATGECSNCGGTGKVGGKLCNICDGREICMWCYGKKEY